MKNWIKYILLIFFAIFFLWVSGCRLERDFIRPGKKLSREEPSYYQFVAQYYYNQKEYEKAIFQYEKLIDQFSDRLDIYQKEVSWANYEIGFCYLLLEKYDDALVYFARVIEDYSYPVSKILAADRIDEINRTLDN